MPTRVIYWTGTWDPQKEAISKEVELLRRVSDAPHPVVSFSAGQRAALDVRNRVVQLSSSQWLVLRAAALLLSRAGGINHIFGGLRSSWHLLRSVRRRPIVFTVVMPGVPKDTRLLEHVDRFVVEDDALEGMLCDAGIARDRIQLIRPGLDLQTFHPALASPSPFRILFASSPADPAEFEARGIPLLVDTARLCPDMEFVFLWRQWGDVTEARRAFLRLSPPANVKIEDLGERQMPAVYRSASAVACLYGPGFGKSSPNSVVEGLACGVPALVSESCGLAPLVSNAGAGLAVRRTPDQVAAAANELRRSHAQFRQSARQLAERAFDVNTFLASYSRLYDDVCRDASAPAATLAAPAGSSRWP